MKKLAALVLLLIAPLAFVPLAFAQAPLRVVVLPFDTPPAYESYGLGLATGLQRSLNSLDGVYVPPVVEAGLFVTRAFNAELDALAVAREAFGAHVMVSGAVTGEGNSLAMTIVLTGEGLAGGDEQLTITAPAEPADALAVLAREVANRLGKTDATAQETVASLASEAPQLAALNPVARASSRLSVSLAEMGSAAQLEPESSWVQSEYALLLAFSDRGEEALAAAHRAREDNPQDADAAVVLGVVASAAGQTDTAREAYRAALDINSAHALALTGLASLSADRAGAAELLQRAVTAAPRLEEAVLGMAQLEANDQRALQFLRRSAANLPESVSLHRAFIERAIAAGDPAGGLAYLAEVVQQPLARSASLYGLAALLPDTQTQRALELVREGRERFPESNGLKATEAELLRRAGDTEQALTLFEELHSDNPENVNVANSLAMLLAEVGDLERAREVLGSVAGENQAAQVNLGRLLIQSGRSRAALDVLAPLAEANPDDAEVRTLHGVALGRTGRVDSALAELERALELDPDNDEARRARDLLQQQRTITGEDAVTLEGEAAQAFERGLHALELGDPAAAVTSFSRALELSSHPLVAFYYGYSLQVAGRTRAALEPYSIALEGFPESDVVLNNLGYAQLQLGRYDLALDTLRRAREANDGNPSVYVNLGLTYYGLGRYVEALEQWQQAISLDPALEAELAQVRARAEELSAGE